MQRARCQPAGQSSSEFESTFRQFVTPRTQAVHWQSETLIHLQENFQPALVVVRIHTALMSFALCHTLLKWPHSFQRMIKQEAT